MADRTVINISDDDDDDDVLMADSTPMCPIAIESDGDDDDDDILIADSKPVCFIEIESDGDDEARHAQEHHRRKRQKVLARDPRLVERTSVTEYKSITPGQCVQLKDGTFLRIRGISKDKSSNFYIAGDHLILRDQDTSVRSQPDKRQEASILPERRNEVVWRCYGSRLSQENGKTDLFETEATQIARRRKIVFTNQPYEVLSFQSSGSPASDRLPDGTDGTLFCRWRWTTVWATNDSKAENLVEHLRYIDADDALHKASFGGFIRTRADDAELRNMWRGRATCPGGDHIEGLGRSALHQYTFGDAFCGSGGTSRGAKKARLKLKWGVDSDSEAIENYWLNFGSMGTECRQQPMFEFIHSAPPIVDVLHASPPCQAFSPANTYRYTASGRAQARNEANEAVSFGTHELIKATKPRIVTMEQTTGLHSHNRPVFNCLIREVLTLGYSVRWKILNLERYGVPQYRDRLVIICAGPAENLPSFPAPTHGRSGSGLQPLVTLNDVLQNVPTAGRTEHDTTHCFPNPKQPFFGNEPAKTMTCSGGQYNYHPSGLRRLTLREFARLQTFPPKHTFEGARLRTKQKQQIGNAVPPLMAQKIFESVIESLKAGDEMDWARPQKGVP